MKKLFLLLLFPILLFSQNVKVRTIWLDTSRANIDTSHIFSPERFHRTVVFDSLFTISGQNVLIATDTNYFRNFSDIKYFKKTDLDSNRIVFTDKAQTITGVKTFTATNTFTDSVSFGKSGGSSAKLRLISSNGTGSSKRADVVISDSYSGTNTLNIPDSSGTLALKEYTTPYLDSNRIVTVDKAQIISNSKTFLDTVLFVNGIELYGDLNEGVITSSSLSAARSWYLPDASGTIAITSDIPSVTSSAFMDSNRIVTVDKAQTIGGIKTFEAGSIRVKDLSGTYYNSIVSLDHNQNNSNYIPDSSGTFALKEYTLKPSDTVGVAFYNKGNVFDHTNYFTARDIHTSIAVDTIDDKSGSGVVVTGNTYPSNNATYSLGKSYTAYDSTFSRTFNGFTFIARPHGMSDNDTTQPYYSSNAYLQGLGNFVGLGYPRGWVGLGAMIQGISYGNQYFRTFADGTSNGGAGMFSDASGNLNIVTFPSTGASNQILNGADVLAKIRLKISSTSSLFSGFVGFDSLRNFAGTTTYITNGTWHSGIGSLSLGNLTTGSISINSSSGITTNQTTFPLLNTTATTINAFGAATSLTLGATSGTTTIRNTTVNLSNATAFQIGGTTLVDNNRNITAQKLRTNNASSALTSSYFSVANKPINVWNSSGELGANYLYTFGDGSLAATVTNAPDYGIVFRIQFSNITTTQESGVALSTSSGSNGGAVSLWSNSVNNIARVEVTQYSSKPSGNNTYFVVEEFRSGSWQLVNETDGVTPFAPVEITGPGVFSKLFKNTFVNTSNNTRIRIYITAGTTIPSGCEIRFRQHLAWNTSELDLPDYRVPMYVLMTQDITFAGNKTFTGSIAVNNVNGITTNQTTFPLLNTTATTVNAFGATTALTLGATSGTATIRNATVNLSNINNFQIRGTNVIDSSANIKNVPTITTTGLSTFGTNAGTATIPAGGVAKVYISGLTTSTGIANVSVKYAGFVTLAVEDTILSWSIPNNDTLQINYKVGKTVSYWIGKK